MRFCFFEVLCIKGTQHTTKYRVLYRGVTVV